MTEPKIVRQEKGKTLWEFEEKGVTARRYLPPGDKPTKTNLRRGIAYGPTLEDFEEVAREWRSSEIAKRLVQSLHRRGVWTRADVHRAGGSRLLRDALLEAFGMQVHDLIQMFEGGN